MSTPTPLPEPEIRPTPVNTLTEIAAINRAINETLASLSPDEKGAFLIYSDGHDAKAAVYANLGAGWSFVAHADYDFTAKKLSYGAQARWTWR